jgi:microcystin-dependent protein
MVSNLGATNKSVLIDIASALTVDLAIPGNINLIWLEGAQVTVSSGKTLTIAGTILAGPFRLWAGAGTVTLSGFDGIHFAEWTGGSNTLGLYTGGTKRGQVDANGLALAAGATVNEFSIDGTMAGNSDAAVPTEKAVKTYVLGTSPQALIGLIIMWPLETIPTGYLECDGASLLRASYADLFTAIGVAYGNADGTHFNVPDYRGYFLRAWAHGQTTDPDKAARTNRGDGTTGDHAGTKQVDGFKSHTHDVWAAVGYAGSTLSNYSVGQYPSQASYATGGNETRPLNVNVMFCIRYV